MSKVRDRTLPLFDGLPVERPAPRDPAAVVAPADAAARVFAVDPRENVVLEASAGTGKTTVLVGRYLNLLAAGVQPANILAITFTRKAAAEMRERIVLELRRGAALSADGRARWQAVRDRLDEIAISTIDAFCLSLLREFPLEADLDPGFSVADETETLRLVGEALDRALRICAGIAHDDEDVALVFAQLGIERARQGLGHLLERRLVAPAALSRFLAGGPTDLTADEVCRRGADALLAALGSLPAGLDAFIEDGPVAHPRFQLLARDLRALAARTAFTPAGLRSLADRLRDHFLNNAGQVRQKWPQYPSRHCASPDRWRRHRQAAAAAGPAMAEALARFQRDLNVVLARGVQRMFAIAHAEYRRSLDAHAVLDFSEVLTRALVLLRQMDEFAQSRFRLESRYHHVLVDEFQDTSRAQWELVSLLVQSWGEGLGLVHDAPIAPSVFVVGDRKQSIYRFRDAEVAVLEEAAQHIAALRPQAQPRRWIAQSFRAVPGLLAFVNEVFDGVDKQDTRTDAFRYDERDRFPTSEVDSATEPCVGIAVGETAAACAAVVADEVLRLLAGGTAIRDKTTGVPRQVRPGDIGILFRSRESHREFAEALERRDIPTYVYKGLGFFDTDEVKDATALIRFLGEPTSDLHVAALLRSRLIRLSDVAVQQLAPRLSAALIQAAPPAPLDDMHPEDREIFTLARDAARDWLTRVDRVPPAELLDAILAETGYAYELRGARLLQGAENLKKLRGIVRRIQNRGYATFRRIAEHLDRLTAGDESNAILDALDAVSLMTVHAAKGLEFPIVFIVNIERGAGGPRPPIRVAAEGLDGEPAVSVGGYTSETDEDERARESEETKRLLYVALTRARDRLYLSAVCRNREFKPGRGSLAEVLPSALGDVFGVAARENPPPLAFAGAGGRTFALRNCTSALAAAGTEQRHDTREGVAAPPETADAFAPIEKGTEWPRLDVTAALGVSAPSPPGAAAEAELRQRVVGTLVHRLLRAQLMLRVAPGLQARGSAVREDAASVARRLLTDEDAALVQDVAAVVAEAIAAARAICSHEQIAALLDRGICRFEVPFSLRIVEDPAGPAILRGTADCVVEHADGALTILEFKTGTTRDAHHRQLALYVRAFRGMSPDVNVDGLLVYPSGVRPLQP